MKKFIYFLPLMFAVSGCTNNGSNGSQSAGQSILNDNISALSIPISRVPDRPTVTSSGSSILISWNSVPNATGYTIYASYSSSGTSNYKTFTSSSTSITIPSTEFPSQKSLYFSVAGFAIGQYFEKSKWAYVATFDDVNLGFMGAITIGDFNNDGCLEVLGTLNDCFGNLIPQSFASLGLSAVQSLGTAGKDSRMADFNGDGIPDLIVNSYSDVLNTSVFTMLFYGRGDGTFIQALPSQFPTIYRGYGETIVVADFDNDGFLDIFLPCYTTGFPTAQNYLLRNRGNGTFDEVATAAGVSNQGVLPVTFKVEGAQAFDLNGDGFLEIYTGSRLYINNGNMTFTDRRRDYGLPNVFDEGAKFYDWNNDGKLDLVLLQPYEGPLLYQFDGLTFTKINNIFQSRYYHDTNGLNVEDVDGDGFMDVIVGAGRDASLGNSMKHTLFLKRQSGYVISDFWAGTPNIGDTVGFADFDRNGTMDIILRSGSLHYLKNTASDTSSIKVFMFDGNGRQNQQGRKILATSQRDPGFIMTRIVDGGSGYLSNNEYGVTFPTPKGDVYWISAQFDNGIVGGWVSAGSNVKIYRDGRFIVQPR